MQNYNMYPSIPQTLGRAYFSESKGEIASIRKSDISIVFCTYLCRHDDARCTGVDGDVASH